MDKESKLSLLSDMIALAKSSEGINEIENDFLSAVARQLGVSEVELQQLVDNPAKPVTIQPEAQRILHFHRLVLLMNVDQDTDSKELLIVKNFGLRLGLSQEAVNKVLSVMNNYPNKLIPPDVLVSIFKTQHN